MALFPGCEQIEFRERGVAVQIPTGPVTLALAIQLVILITLLPNQRLKLAAHVD
jgi:hypothetical protein